MDLTIFPCFLSFFALFCFYFASLITYTCQIQPLLHILIFLALSYNALSSTEKGLTIPSTLVFYLLPQQIFKWAINFLPKHSMLHGQYLCD